MIKKKSYYIGFYRDYNSKHRPFPLVCQVTDNIDCSSCELLGGDYPFLEIFSTPTCRDKTALQIAKQYNSSSLEIQNYPRKKI